MNKRRFPRLLPFVLVIVAIAASTSAEVPNYVNYQGRLTDDGGLPITGSQLLKFKIYGSPSGDDSLWSSSFRAVEINDGLFSIQLGSVVPLPDDLFTGDAARYLGITVDTDAEFLPRIQFITVPYSYHAVLADSAITAPITTDNDWIVDGNDVYHPTGYVGIGNTNPREDLVVGNDIGNYSGNRVVISDTESGVGTGLVIGKSNDSRSWILWDVDDSYLSIGTKEEGVNKGNTLTIKDGCVGIGTTGPPDSASLDVLENGIGDENILAGQFKALNPATSEGDRRGLNVVAGIYTNIDGMSSGIRTEARGGEYSYGIMAYSSDASIRNTAGYFWGDVEVFGNITKTSGSFKIDHPLDPENRYLQHSFVESPDMMNIYNGNVITDSDGEAEVALPTYFEALNRDFRYQLTVIGTFAQAIVGEKIQNGRFVIKTDKPNIEVSWQVTGIRKDVWANEHRIEVEVEKPEKERGYYIAPELYGHGEDKSIDHKLHGSRKTGAHIE